MLRMRDAGSTDGIEYSRWRDWPLVRRMSTVGEGRDAGGGFTPLCDVRWLDLRICLSVTRRSKRHCPIDRRNEQEGHIDVLGPRLGLPNGR